MKSVTIFTDGSCLGNPGPGGWAALLRHEDSEKELSGGEASTTNNRMELMAAVEALNALKEPCAVTLTTDSRYVRDGIRSWIGKWRRNGWRTKKGDPVKNQDLWEKLDAAAGRHDIEWCWIKGHSGHAENTRVDELARGRAEAEAARPDGRPSSGAPTQPGRSGMKYAEIFIGGSCLGDTGSGGWAALLRLDGAEREIGGGASSTTNNRMELMAAIEALNALSEPCAVTLTTNSRYVQEGLDLWLEGWKRNGWRTGSREPVKNRDLWQALDAVAGRHDIECRWIKARSGHAESARVAELARGRAKAEAARPGDAGARS